jgi:hypothetical protein
MKIRFPYSYFDRHSALLEHLGLFDVATAQCFGIAAGWIDDEEIKKMFPDADEGMRVYQIACMICKNALRRAVVQDELDAMVDSTVWLKMLYEGFASEALCHHFEQFAEFGMGLDKTSEYARGLNSAIEVQARLLETTA